MDKLSKYYVIGIDYGTDSCRAIVVDAVNGKELSSSVSYYPRWKAGKYINPQCNQYRQHPLDYIETLEEVVNNALASVSSEVKSRIVGISFDTTGSTPVLVDENGTPLALLPEFTENPNAMFVLWKDHTAIKEASEINLLSKTWSTDYTAYEGGIYSSEWVWSKILHLLREDTTIRNKAYSWMEHCDWITALVTGNTIPEEIYRSRCVAGHKAMWNERWDGLPSEDFLTTLDPLLSGYRKHLYTKTYTSDQVAGILSVEWAKRLGLSTQVSVSVGSLDAHIGAVGACIRPNVLTRIMGTSTCDILISDREELGDKLVQGICGQVEGSVIPGFIGMEAGQSAFGDIYSWFREVLSWPLQGILSQSKLADEETKKKLINESIEQIIPQLSIQAADIPLKEATVLALDWMNGRRTPDANQLLKGAISGLSLGTTAPMIFRALVEATAFGSKAIIDRFAREGVQINEIIAIGGISQKSPFVMQVLSDVLNMPIKVIKSEQTCALGAAMFAAVAGGVYTTVEEAQLAMGSGVLKEYFSNKENHKVYMKLYDKYLTFGSLVEEAL